MGRGHVWGRRGPGKGGARARGKVQRPQRARPDPFWACPAPGELEASEANGRGGPPVMLLESQKILSLLKSPVCGRWYPH